MRIHFIWMLALLTLLPARAFSDEDAQAHYKKGLGAYGLGHYSQAAAEYEKAFALEPQPALLYDAAQAHKLAGDGGRALELYKNYLRLYGDEAKNRRDVDKKIAELTDELTHPSQAPAVSSAPAQPELLPVEVTLRTATPAWSEPCPAHLSFSAVVSSRRPEPSELRYRVTRSDHSHGATLQVDLPGTSAGARQVALPPFSWTIGKAGKHYEGWVQLEILSPPTTTSNRASFTVDCP